MPIRGRAAIILKIREFGWENGLAIRAGDDTSTAGEGRCEVHLVTQQPDGFQRRHCLLAIRALDRRFQPVNRVESVRVPHPESFRLIQTVALLEVTPLSESAATLTRMPIAVAMAEEMNGGR